MLQKIEPSQSAQNTTIVRLALIGLLVTGCSDDTQQAVGIAHDSSLALDRESAFTILLDGNSHDFGYVGNCTLSPVLSGVAAWEAKPNLESTASNPAMRLNAITENGESSGQIEVVLREASYVYEGPVTIDGKTIRWSGAFDRFEFSTSSKPPEKTGAVVGSGEIRC